MELQKALETTGFTKCDFEPDSDPCECCGKHDQHLYYRRTDYWENEGEYFCADCVIAQAQQIDSLIEITCPSCGDQFTGWPDQKDGLCIDCYAAITMEKTA